MLSNDVEDLTEENQQLRKECETATSELATLKEQLLSLEEKVCMCACMHTACLVRTYVRHSVCMCELHRLSYVHAGPALMLCVSSDVFSS